MSGLFGTLGVAYSGVAASQAGVQITGHNVSNANTEGYHRRTLKQSAMYPPPVLGGGVQIDGIHRYANELLAKQVASVLGDQGWADARQHLLLQVEGSLTTVDGGSLGGSVADLYNSFSMLATDPKDTAVRQDLIATGQRLVDRFNHAAKSLSDIADGADREIASHLPQVNEAARAIASLNGEIRAAEASGVDGSDLRDRRDLLVAEIVGLTGATYFEDEGQIAVLVGGQSLVQGDQYATLEATPDTVLNGYNRIDLVIGSSRHDITSVVRGEIGGMIEVRDTSIPAFQAKLDQLAFDLVDQINTQHSAGFGLDGVDNRNFFEPLAGVNGAAAALTLRTGLTTDEIAASSTAAGLPGNNENALALSGLRSANLGATSDTASEGFASFVGQIGTATANALSEAAVGADELASLQAMKESAEGVSTEEEMVHLIQFQRAFQANAKVLRTVDELLAELMRI